VVPGYGGRSVIIDRYGRRGPQDGRLTTPQVPLDLRAPTPVPAPASPTDPGRTVPGPSDGERLRGRAPSLYQGTIPAPRADENWRHQPPTGSAGGQRPSETFRDRFRNAGAGGWRHDRILPVDRYRPFDHVCDSRCHGEHHYVHHCDGSCRHRHYDYGSPYGPVIVPVYVPVYEPYIVYEPRTEVVIVPRAPEAPPAPRAPERTWTDRLAEPMPLGDVIADMEEAWEKGDLNLLMRHVSPELSVEIYEQGALLYKLNRDQFGQQNLEAFRRYKTLEMRFARPEFISEMEAVATGTHVFRDEQGEERRVRVIYAFRKQGEAWRLAGVDFSREADGNAVEPTAAVTPTDLVAEPETREVALLFAKAAGGDAPGANPTRAHGDAALPRRGK